MNEILDAILGFIEDVPPVLRILLTGIAIMLETSVSDWAYRPRRHGGVVLQYRSDDHCGVHFHRRSPWLTGALLGELLSVFGSGESLVRSSAEVGWVIRIGEDRWRKADRFVKKARRYCRLHFPLLARFSLRSSAHRGNVRLCVTEHL